MYTAFCDLYTNDKFHGTICLITTIEHDDACMAMDSWADYPIMTTLRDFLLAQYGHVEIIAYVKKVA